MGYFSLYIDFVKIKFKSVAEYPSAFILTTISKILGIGSGGLITYLTVYRFGNVMSWSTYEVLLLFSFNSIGYALAGFFMYHPFTKLQQRIKDGTFDEMLTKPLNPFFYLCSREFSTGYFANLTVGIVFMVISFVKLNITLSLSKIIFLILSLLGAGMIHSGFFMFANIPCFWLIKSDAIGRLRSTLESFIRYPISIYDTWIAIMLTYVFPFAFVNFFPAQFFLDKSDFIIFPPIFALITPIVGIVMVLLGYAFFNLGIKYYNSTGS